MGLPGILIVAAGLGRRYLNAGGKGNKLDQALSGNRTVFYHTLSNARQTGLPLCVITRPDYCSIQTLCYENNVPCYCAATEGLGETIAFGVGVKSDWQGWLIQPADMPFVAPQIMSQVANALANALCARPIYRGLPGHPVGFGREAYDDLLNLSGEQGAKTVLKKFPPLLINCDDADVIRDIDLPLK